MSDNHITKEQLWREFFGNFGRDFGNPQRRFSANPSEIYQFVDECTKNKLPSFISVNPKQDKDTVCGLEKLFFDFDCYEENYVNGSIQRRIEMETEVKLFLSNLEHLNIKPLIVKTSKGYHVYVFFDYTYKIEKNQQGFYKQIYEELQRLLLQGQDYKYIDEHVIGDINRLCRIPLSIHQKTGEKCIIVDSQLREDKIRSLEFFKLYGLKENDLKLVARKIIKTKKPLRSRPYKTTNLTNNSFKEIRPCFKKAMAAGEMIHEQRLALLLEIYSLGYHDLESIAEFFKCFNDFSEDETRKQVQWFLDNEVQRGFTRPYKCNTIQEKGWCIGEQCAFFKG